jgi:hypothetical protein
MSKVSSVDIHTIVFDVFVAIFFACSEDACTAQAALAGTASAERTTRQLSQEVKILAADNAGFGRCFAAQFDQACRVEVSKALCANEATPVLEAKGAGTLFEPVFACGCGTLPDDGGVFNVEFTTETVDAEEAETWHVIDVGHDQHTGDVTQAWGFGAMLSV